MFSQITQTFARFTHIANKYARDIILLNLEYLQTELHSTNEKIMDMDATLTSLLPANELKRFKETTTKSLSRFKENLENTKHQKWHRDVEDYKSGMIYNWQRDNLMRNTVPVKSTQKRKRHLRNSDIDYIDSPLF